MVVGFTTELPNQSVPITTVVAILNLDQDEEYNRPVLVVEETGILGREPPTMGKQLVNFYHLRLRVECTLF
jgi:hypothetical protein